MQPNETPAHPETEQPSAAADQAPDQALSLPASLDLTCADSLHHALQDHIAQQRGVLLDGREVERVGTPCVQLLVAAAASARAHGQPFRILAASQALRQAARDLALGDVLGLEDAG
jgi:anti-anti-sigma regulatory factor